MSEDLEHTEGHGAADNSAGEISELSGRITSWRDFSDRVSAAMAMAAADPGDISLSDRDFAQWPLGARAVVEAFQQWVMGSSKDVRCHVLAGHFDGFAAAHPRWIQWRKLWSHRVPCRQAEEEMAAAVPTVLVLHGRLALRVVDPLIGRGLWSRDTKVVDDWLAEVDVISQRSYEALPTTTLGL